MMGTFAQAQIEDLKAKTKRGMIGNVKAGKIPSGLAFGYDVAKLGDDIVKSIKAKLQLLFVSSQITQWVKARH